MDNFEQIKTLYEKYISLIRKFFGEEQALALETAVGERLVLAARGQKPDEGGVAGGLVSYALDCAVASKIFSKDKALHKSLIRVALVHELGKVGSLNDPQDLFIPEQSDWHREKLGRHYKYNENCPRMVISHRTLYYLAKLNFDLNEDEWQAVLTSGGLHLEENKYYGHSNHQLSILFQAIRVQAQMHT